MLSFFTETTQFQATYTVGTVYVDFMSCTTTTVPGCRVEKINKLVFLSSVNTVGCRRPSLNTVDNSNSCFFTETTQFQTTATADFMFTTTTVSPGFRVNWAIHDVLHILVTFPQLLWLSLSLEYLQKFITDSVKGWPCTFLVGCCVPDWKKVGWTGPGFSIPDHI